MSGSNHILLLAGSFEARRLAEALSARAVRYTVWLSEPPRGPAPLPQVPKLRRFEDATSMRAAIAAEGFTAVIDAAHAFDRTATRQANAAAKALGLAYLRVERPAWNCGAHSGWHSAPDVASAATHIPDGARVFSTTGWDSLADYANFRGDTLLLRQTRRHDRAVPFPFVKLIFGDPPFDAEHEGELFRELGVSLLICRNIGGVASRPKLDAALKLGLGVVLVDRPALPCGIAVVADLGAALDWVGTL